MFKKLWKRQIQLIIVVLLHDQEIVEKADSIDYR
jgi:hypothetical protein